MFSASFSRLSRQSEPARGSSPRSAPGPCCRRHPLVAPHASARRPGAGLGHPGSPAARCSPGTAGGPPAAGLRGRRGAAGGARGPGGSRRLGPACPGPSGLRLPAPGFTAAVSQTSLRRKWVWIRRPRLVPANSARVLKFLSSCLKLLQLLVCCLSPDWNVAANRLHFTNGKLIRALDVRVYKYVKYFLIVVSKTGRESIISGVTNTLLTCSAAKSPGRR